MLYQLDGNYKSMLSQLAKPFCSLVHPSRPVCWSAGWGQCVDCEYHLHTKERSRLFPWQSWMWKLKLRFCWSFNIFQLCFPRLHRSPKKSANFATAWSGSTSSKKCNSSPSATGWKMISQSRQNATAIIFTMLWSCGSLYPGGFHIKANTTESRLYCTSAFRITLCQAKLCQDAWIRWGPGTGMREIRKKSMLWKPWNHDIQNVALNFERKNMDLGVKLASHKWHLQLGLRMDLGEVWTNRFDGALRHSTTKWGTCGSPLGCVAEIQQ